MNKTAKEMLAIDELTKKVSHLEEKVKELESSLLCIKETVHRLEWGKSPKPPPAT